MKAWDHQVIAVHSLVHSLEKAYWFFSLPTNFSISCWKDPDSDNFTPIYGETSVFEMQLLPSRLLQKIRIYMHTAGGDAKIKTFLPGPPLQCCGGTQPGYSHRSVVDIRHVLCLHPLECPAYAATCTCQKYETIFLPWVSLALRPAAMLPHLVQGTITIQNRASRCRCD